MTLTCPVYPSPAGFPYTRRHPMFSHFGWTFDEVELVAKPLTVEVKHSAAFDRTPVDDALDAQFAEVFRRNAVEAGDTAFAPVVVDDSPAALIARLTAGDRGDA